MEKIKDGILFENEVYIVKKKVGNILNFVIQSKVSENQIQNYNIS